MDNSDDTEVRLDSGAPRVKVARVGGVDEGDWD